MKRILLVLLLLFNGLLWGSFTEFYCDNSTGSNLNGGAPIGGSYPFTYASGSWVQSTGVFTVASGNPSSDGVTVGDFASVYADGAGAPTGFVGRVTARDTTTITVSLTAKSGSAPTDGTNNRTIKVGGAWKGPNAGSGFPLSFVTNALVDSTGNAARIDMKNTSDYLVSSNVAMANAGLIVVQGYTSSVGDGGRFTLDGQTNAIDVITLSGGTLVLADAIVKSSATSGSGRAVQVLGSNTLLHRLVATGSRLSCFGMLETSLAYECEAYGCNTSNSAAEGGFLINTGGGAGTCIRCMSHDNAGSFSNGFYLNSTGTLISCVASTNGDFGFITVQNSRFVSCDAYNNGSDGFRVSGGLLYSFDNCNAIKNGAYGIRTNVGGSAKMGWIANCGFGAGTQANPSGNTDLPVVGSAMIEVGSVSYPANLTPWVDPANGDFRINLAQARGTGRGNFTETAPSYSGTIGYPDIGAAQHRDVGTSSTFISRRNGLLRRWGFQEGRADETTESNLAGLLIPVLVAIFVGACTAVRKKGNNA